MAIIKRLGKYGVQVYRGKGEYEWIGTFPSWGEAKAAERSAIATGPTSAETCGEFAERWVREYNRILSDGSLRWADEHLRGLTSALKPFVERFGDEKLAQFPNREAKPWAATQKYFTIKAVRAMFNDAVPDLIDTNPFAALGMERSRGRSNIIAITEQELGLLSQVAADEADDTEHGEIMRALILFQGYVGTRGIGVRNIRSDDVDLAARTVYVRKPGKGVAPRTIFLPDPAAEAVARMPERLRAEWLFTSIGGAKLNKSNLFYVWKDIRKEFHRRLDPRRADELRESRPQHSYMQFHELRHCACTIMARRGVDPQTAAWQLCQTDEGELVKQVYSHLTDEERHGFLSRAFSSHADSDARADTELRDVG